MLVRIGEEARRVAGLASAAAPLSTSIAEIDAAQRRRIASLSTAQQPLRRGAHRRGQRPHSAAGEGNDAPDCRVTFPPVAAAAVRLVITAADIDIARVHEIELYDPLPQ